MKLLLTLGWRNIWRNRRRSLITILAVTFAVMLSIVMRGIQLGTYDVNIRHVVELFSGYLQIQAPGYQKNPSLHKSFKLSDSLRVLLETDKRVIGTAPRILGDGLISYRDYSQGAVIVGIDPELERQVSKLPSRVTSGSFLASDRQDAIVVGHKLLENLKAQTGDTIVLLSQGFDGSLGNLRFVITGALKSGLGDLDRSLVLMNLDAARELLVMEGRVSLIAIKLDDLGEISSFQEDHAGSLETMGMALLEWKEVMPDFEQSIELDNVSGILTLGILILVVAFGITNTVLMSVTERFREFGIILSIGMQHTRLVWLIFLETVMIIVLGLVLGNILAYGINYYLVLNPIEFSGEFGAIYEEYGWLPRLESTLKLSSFLNTSLAILVISIVSTLYPIMKVLKLEPLKGIRYT